MAQTSSRKAQQRRRFQKRRQETRPRLRPPSSALSPEIPGPNGPYNPTAPIDPLAPLVPTSVDNGTQLG